MPVSGRARRIKALFAMIAATGAVSVGVYVCHLNSAPAPPRPSPLVRADSQSSDQIDVGEPAIGEEVSLGRVLGTNNPAVPPITIPVGRLPNQDDAPDLSNPAVAVYTVLSLIDQDATDKLAACFIEEIQDATSSLFPRYLGHPIELVDVVEDGDSALVFWKATVHTELSLDGRRRSAGEKMALTTRLVQIEGVWKLLRLHEGSKNDSE